MLTPAARTSQTGKKTIIIPVVQKEAFEVDAVNRKKARKPRVNSHVILNAICGHNL